jgi:hypothetical protein
MTDWEGALTNLLIDDLREHVPKDYVFYVNEYYWEKICALWKERGDGEPKMPLINGVPVRRKHD